MSQFFGAGHRPFRVKAARKESEESKGAGMEVDGKVRQKEDAEIQSPKRKVIRVESEETQDYDRESLNLSPEGAEEIGFVLSALSIPRGLWKGATTASVKTPSVTGTRLPLWRKMMARRTQ